MSPLLPPKYLHAEDVKCSVQSCWVHGWSMSVYMQALLKSNHSLILRLSKVMCVVERRLHSLQLGHCHYVVGLNPPPIPSLKWHLKSLGILSVDTHNESVDKHGEILMLAVYQVIRGRSYLNLNNWSHMTGIHTGWGKEAGIQIRLGEHTPPTPLGTDTHFFPLLQHSVWNPVQYPSCLICYKITTIPIQLP